MVSKRRCPYTGVLNLFSESDPHLALGSVVRAGTKGGYLWRCYASAEPLHGLASDARTAEMRLVRQIEKAALTSEQHQTGCAA